MSSAPKLVGFCLGYSWTGKSASAGLLLFPSSIAPALWIRPSRALDKMGTRGAPASSLPMNSAQSGKAADYLVKSSIDFQKILIDVQFQAPTPLANQPSDPNSPDVGSMDFRLMHAPRVKCPIVGRGGDSGCAAMTTKRRTGLPRPAPT